MLCRPTSTVSAPAALTVLALLSSLALAGCGGAGAPAAPPADLVLTGGKVVTLDPDTPEGGALAVTGGRVTAVGDEAAIAAYIGPDTEVVELDGALAIPGFIEGHGHFLGLGQAQLELDLNGVANWDQVVEMVAAAVAEAPAGAWIEGRGWHQEKWDRPPEPNVDGLPVHGSLSAVSPDNPVVLRHASGHASFANARAMELAGIGRDTQPPPGGEIVRGPDGEAIGVFREKAAGLVARGQAPSRAELRQRAELAAEAALAAGITSFQDAGSPPPAIDLFRDMAEAGELGVRLWVMITGSSEPLAELLPAYRLQGVGDHHLTVGGIKLWLDGALGSHGAWLLAPYSDKPSSTGLVVTPLEEVERVGRLALEHGYQLCVHAIGDRANRELLDLYEALFASLEESGERPAAEELRWRIEHAQHLHPDDIPRFAELGVIASMQAVHCTSDGPWVPTRLGDERAREGAYVWRSLLDSGARIANGTDTPVEAVSPVASYYAAVARRLPDGSRFYPEQAMSRQEALASYTLDAAYAAFEEELKGSLAPGKLGDITVLDRDILTVPEEEIAGARVLMTIVGGQVRYRADADPDRLR